METAREKVHVSPAAMLAAILYNLDKTTEVKLKPDDQDGMIKQQINVVEVMQEGNSLLCAIPMKYLLHFCKVDYQMSFNVVQPHGNTNPDQAIAMIGFEKAIEKPQILGANGQAALPSKSFETLLQKVKLNGKE